MLNAQAKMKELKRDEQVCTSRSNMSVNRDLGDDVVQVVLPNHASVPSCSTIAITVSNLAIQAWERDEFGLSAAWVVIARHPDVSAGAVSDTGATRKKSPSTAAAQDEEGPSFGNAPRDKPHRTETPNYVEPTTITSSNRRRDRFEGAQPRNVPPTCHLDLPSL